MASERDKGKSSTPWRFLLFFAVLAAGWAIGIWQLGWSKGLLAGFDIAALVFLITHLPVFRETAKTLRGAAARNDANRVTLSMGLLELASRSIPMGTAYAVWGGIGAVGTVMVGMAFFNEPSTTIRLLLILAIVACIAALKLTA